MLRRALSAARRRLGLAPAAPPPPPAEEETGPPIYYFVESTVSSPFNTGIQRVARQFARALIELGYPLVPVKWGGPLQPFHPVSDAELAHFARWNGPPPEAWRAWRPRPDPATGGWFVMAELPTHLSPRQQAVLRDAAASAGLNTAAVFYDAIPWKMRDLYPDAVAQAHRAYMAELGLYDRVLAISEHSRRDLIAALGAACGRPPETLGHILACPLPAEFPQAGGAEAAAPARAPGGPARILCVGSVEPRKNHELLLRAFDLARAGGASLHLTIAGGAHGLDPGLAGRVRAKVDADPDLAWIEDASDAQLAALYEACDFTVYPSLEEGFGMPILESLWHRKPVVCANFGAMAENAEGGGCLTTDTRDPAALARALAELTADAGLRGRLAEEAGRRRFRSWRDYAQDAGTLLGFSPPVA